MSAESENLQTLQKPARRARRKISMERVMVLFTILFGVGIALLVAFPEGHPLRGMSMTLYSVLVFWSMFRFGI